LPTDVGEAQEIKGLGLSKTLLTAVLDRIATELDEARLVGMQFQAELRKSFA